MQNTENCGGARHRLLIFMYITCLTLSLAPAMVPPPEKEFAQGQPELQLAMDNMVTHKSIVKKRTSSSPSDGKDDTISYLAEAERVLSNFKHKKWIEGFIQHIKSLATQDNNENTRLNSASGTPVPEILPSQPTWPATPAVLGINAFQKSNKMMSKFSVTSPELSKVLQENDYPSEHQAVTKPAVLSIKKQEVEESDELVRELENLHREMSHASLQNSKVLDPTLTVTTPSTAFPLETTDNAKSTNVESQKEKLKVKLIEEIAEFHRLGGEIPKEVVNALHTNNQKAAAITNVDDKMKFTEAGMVDRQGIQKINDFSNEEISKANMQNIPPQAEQYHPLKFNHTFQYMHSNFHPNLQEGNYLYYVSPQNKEPYPGHAQNAAQGLQKSSSVIQGKYHGMVAPPNQQLGHIPDALKQILSKPHNKFYNGHLTNTDYYNYLMRHGSSPYPYAHSLDFKNSTFYPDPEMPVLSKQHMNHMIDTQLSDEMKRELRDGKIIVLSDSLVRSNFEPNKNDKTTENTTGKQKPKKTESKKSETDFKN